MCVSVSEGDSPFRISPGSHTDELVSGGGSEAKTPIVVTEDPPVPMEGIELHEALEGDVDPLFTDSPADDTEAVKRNDNFHGLFSFWLEPDLTQFGPLGSQLLPPIGGTT